MGAGMRSQDPRGGAKRGVCNSVTEGPRGLAYAAPKRTMPLKVHLLKCSEEEGAWLWLSKAITAVSQASVHTIVLAYTLYRIQNQALRGDLEEWRGTVSAPGNYPG